MLSVASAGCLCIAVLEDGENLLNSVYINQRAAVQGLNLVSRYAWGDE